MDPRVLKATSVKAEDPAAQSPEPQALKITAASSNPKMFTLPWEKPLATWPEDLLVNLPRGISRHVVRFVHVGDEVYAMKEITRNVAEREYELLRRLQKLELPTVQPIAVVTGRHNAQGEPLEAILVTKHLKFSLPYRALFARNLRPDTAERLIDALAVLMVLALAACGTKNNDKMGDMSGNGSAMTGEPKNAEEALALHKELLEQENAILSENTELWEKVFMEADKGMAMIEDGKNYGDFLLDTVEAAKEQFTDKEYEWLKESATEISNIENRLTELEEKYPEIMQKSMDGDMSIPAGSDTSNPPDDGSMQKFPAFEGKDLDGNTVKSDELFSANAVTVVNFWFTTCNPCVGELSELDALNKELAEKGGSLIGVNTFTLDGDETAISEAKDVLAKKGATYQNVYFDSDGEAGKFTTNIFAYPTTYVVDRSGNIVGEPIVGAITEKKQAETLQKLIDQALAADMG